MGDVCVSLVSDEDSDRISLALLGDDSAMDDIPLFSPAGAQAWLAYNERKSQLPVVTVSEEDLAKISAAVLGDDSAMDDIPFFSPAGVQAWRSYHYRKRQMLAPVVSFKLLSDEDFSKISAEVLGDDSAMDDIPLFSPAGEQAWRAYDYIKHVDRHWQF